MSSLTASYVLTISCADRVGIVAAVSGFLAAKQCFIEESSHFGDATTDFFFMRTRFSAPDDHDHLIFQQDFASMATGFKLNYRLYPVNMRPKVLVMCSKQDHCIRDLLYKAQSNSINMDIVAVVSNHTALADVCSWYDVPFHHVAVTKGAKHVAERQLQDIYQKSGSELIVLARYMQILSPEFCDALPGQVINIHHSFLPSFKGAKPYHKAHAHGVKLIGATAHYVTADLDEGPIIEQDVVRVNHACSVADMIALGKDVEAKTLSKAVQYHLQRRVFVDQGKTVVFRD